MRFRLGLGFLILCLLLPAAPACNADELADLKAAHERGLAAYNARDAAAFVANTHDEAIGFDAFAPRAVDYKAMGREAVQQAWAAFFEGIESASVVPVNPQYRVVGDTAISWGYYEVLIKPVDGPMRGLFLRYTTTAVKTGGKWTTLTNHVSLVPSDTYGF